MARGAARTQLPRRDADINLDSPDELVTLVDLLLVARDGQGALVGPINHLYTCKRTRRLCERFE